MKWIGQNIWDEVSRFRSDVHINGGTLYGSSGGIGTLPIIAGDITIYNAVNDGNPTISLGSSATERLEIKAQYESGAQGFDGAIFTTYTAGSSTNDGRFTFFVDEVGTFQIRDHGINLYAGKSLQIGNTDILTDDGSGGTTLNNIDAVDATTVSTLNAALTAGDITGVTAGTGLSGGGSSGDVTLNVDAAQSGITSLGTLTGLTLDGDKNITPGDGSMIHLDTSTLTDNSTLEGGTAAKFASVALEAPTLAASNESTVTDAATLYISGAPSAGTNSTLTRQHAIWVDAGNVRLDGEIYMGTTRAMDSSGLLRVADQSTITGLGTISSGTWQGTAIASGYLDCSGVTNVGTLVDLAVTGASDLGGPSVALTHQDVDQIALDIDASNTTANILDINAQALTTGAAIYIDCNNLASHTGGGALHIDVDENSTGAIQNTLAHINYDRTGDLTGTSTNATTGLSIEMNDLATGNATFSTSSLTGLNIELDHANANGLHYQTGIDLTLTDADPTVGGVWTTVGLLSTVEDGGADIKMQSSADTGDWCTIATTTHGATTITTYDDDATAAHFEIAADGDITLDSAGQIKLEPVAGNNILLDGTVTVDGGAIGGLASLTSSDNLTITSAADLDIVATGNDITVDTDTFTLESSTADSPTVVIKNTTADNQGARLQMKKDRGAAMVQGDRVGEIDFIGEDADQNTQQYGKILTRADVVTGGQESGKMVLQVASHDGDLENAFILIGGDEDGEVDATVGLGANSVVTIPGNIDLAGDIDVDGTLETDALTVGGVAFTPSTTKQVTHHMIGDDIDSDVVFISLGELDAENTSVGNKALPLIAPTAGKLLKIFCRTTVDMSSETFTWKLYTRTTSQSTNGTVAEVGAQSGAGPTNKTMVTYDFTTGLDSGTNAIAAGDKVQISIEASDGSTSNNSYFITCLWEWDLS